MMSLGVDYIRLNVVQPAITVGKDMEHMKSLQNMTCALQDVTFTRVVHEPN